MKFNGALFKNILFLSIFILGITSCAVKKKQTEITAKTTKKEAPVPDVMVMPKPAPSPPRISVEKEEMPVFVDQEIEVAPTPLPKKRTGEIYKVVNQMPHFPGCEGVKDVKKKRTCADIKLLQFIQKNISYPVEARKNHIEGRCYVTFVVEKTGQLSNIKLLRNIGGGCGEEALRVVNLMNTKGIIFTPGRHRNKVVRVQFNIPVHFRLH